MYSACGVRVVVFEDQVPSGEFPVAITTIMPRAGEHPPPLTAYIDRDQPADTDCWEPAPGVRITRHDGYDLEGPRPTSHTGYPRGGNLDVGDSSDLPLVVIVLPAGWAAIVPADPDNPDDPHALAHLYDDRRLILTFNKEDEDREGTTRSWWKTHWLMYHVDTREALVQSRAAINHAFRHRRPAPRLSLKPDPGAESAVIAAWAAVAVGILGVIVGALGPGTQTVDVVVVLLAASMLVGGLFTLVRGAKRRGWRLRGGA